MNNPFAQNDQNKQFFTAIKDLLPSSTFNQLLVANRMFMCMLEGVIITDINGNIQFMNPAFKKITGYGEELIGQNPRVLQSGRHDDMFYKQMWHSIVENGQWQGEIWNRRKNGELYIQSTTITQIVDDEDKTIYYASVITDIMQKTIEQQQIQEDLMLAREIQKGTLNNPIHNDRIEIEGIFEPSYYLGGDLYAWYKLNEDEYGVILLDVMGHGVSSALVSMSVKTLLRGIITKTKYPEIVLQELNHHLYLLFHEDSVSHVKQYYLSCIYVYINTRSKTIRYASAGHPPGLLVQSDGTVIELDKGTIPLGMLPEIEIESDLLTYDAQNTKIILYTDGITENLALSTRQNIEQLKQVILSYPTLHGEKLLQKITKEMLEKQKKPFEDDVTMVSIRL